MKRFTPIAILFAGLFLLIAALVVAGRYTTVTAGGFVYVVDRLTGQVRFCASDGCRIATDLDRKP